MDTIVKEGLISFKELEQKVFKYVCELGCEITRIILESYDKELAASRDSRQYRDKGGGHGAGDEAAGLGRVIPTAGSI